MARQFFKDLPDTSTPLTASRLNGLLDGEEPMGNLVVDSIKTKNMLNINNLSNWAGANTTASVSNNELTVSGSYYVSYLINVKPNTDYYMSAIRTITTSTTNTGSIRIFKTDQSTPITSHNTGNFSFNSGSNSQVYVAFYAGTGSNGVVKFSNVQLEEGSIASTYSPYQNLTGEEHYSTEEQVIGTWTNGKPLYRKVVATTLPNGSNDILIDANIQTIWLENGYFNSPSGNTNRYFTIPFINDSAKRVLGWGLSTGYFHLINEISSYNGVNCYLSLVYTKTTD